jgi:anaphase-promoting complex subunit 2
MLRDILDSRRLDLAIRNDQRPPTPSPSSSSPPQILTSKILSHLFWPSLHTESFALPAPISALQTHYATTFSALKPSRKLTWLPSLGQVTVHLDLADRVVREEVPPWHATVIYAFSSPTNSPAPTTKTVPELITRLAMSELLVRNALTFWVSKLVLAQQGPTPDTYRVLETLTSETLAPTSAASVTAQAAAASEAVSSVAAVRSEEEMQSERMEVFWQFVVGMLTNQGAMRLERIVMMLKMVVPGGFPFGNEEMREFLGGKVEEGRLEVGGGGYRIVH